jgi:hypothetical protein
MASNTNALVDDEESVYSAVSSYDSDATVSFDIVTDALRKESQALEELMIARTELANLKHKLTEVREELMKAHALLSLIVVTFLSIIKFIMNIVLIIMGIKPL